MCNIQDIQSEKNYSYIVKQRAEDACKKFKLADDIKKMEKEHEL
jgi:hypothetical protein